MQVTRPTGYLQTPATLKEWDGNRGGGWIRPNEFVQALPARTLRGTQMACPGGGLVGNLKEAVDMLDTMGWRGVRSEWLIEC